MRHKVKKFLLALKGGGDAVLLNPSDPFDKGIVGVFAADGKCRVVYDRVRLVEELAKSYLKDGTSPNHEEAYYDACEWLAYNTDRALAYLPKKTRPVLLRPLPSSSLDLLRQSENFLPFPPKRGGSKRDGKGRLVYERTPLVWLSPLAHEAARLSYRNPNPKRRSDELQRTLGAILRQRSSVYLRCMAWARLFAVFSGVHLPPELRDRYFRVKGNWLSTLSDLERPAERVLKRLDRLARDLATFLSLVPMAVEKNRTFWDTRPSEKVRRDRARKRG